MRTRSHPATRARVHRTIVCLCTSRERLYSGVRVSLVHAIDALENAESRCNHLYIHIETHFATRRQTHDKGETAKCLVSNGVWPRQWRPTGSLQSIYGVTIATVPTFRSHFLRIFHDSQFNALAEKSRIRTYWCEHRLARPWTQQSSIQFIFQRVSGKLV